MKKRFKLLAVVQLPPPIHGASVMNSFVVHSEYLRERYSMTVIPLRYASSIQDIGRFRMVKLLKAFLSALRMGFAILRGHPDLVYFTLSPVGGAFYRDIMFVAVMKLLRVKRVYHLHGKGVRSAATHPLNRFMYKWVFKDAYVIHLSRLLYFDIQQFVEEDKCYFLANGITDFAKQEININKKSECKELRILYLSNFVKEKGPIVLLNALVKLKDKGVSFKAIYAGSLHSRQCKEEYDKIVRLNNLSEKVTYVGPKYGNEKNELLQASDVLAFPTSYECECFPLVILEAMSFGLPVLTTPEGAIPEIVEDGVTGFLTMQNDAAALADKLQLLAEDKFLRRQMGIAARCKYLRCYTKEKFESNLVVIIDSCLSH